MTIRPCMRSARLPELQVAFFESLRIWFQLRRSWNQEQFPAVQCLQAVPEHRTIFFLEDVPADLHHEVWAYAENVPIEGRMVDLAECETVRDHWVSPRVTVVNDVRRFEQLCVAKTTYGATLSIGAQDSSAERFLVDTSLGDYRDVFTYQDVRGLGYAFARE